MIQKLKSKKLKFINILTEQKISMKKLLLIFTLFTFNSCVEAVALATYGTVYYAQKDKTVKESVTDSKITRAVKKQLKKSNKKNYRKVKVNTYEGRVLLSGSVLKNVSVEKIAQITWKTSGVKEVMNEVRKQGYRRSHVRDAYLALRIKTKLLLNKEIKSTDIDVEVYNGEVILLGEQNSRAAIEKSAKIAARVRGVKKVTSLLKDA
jgi:hyperosmotically inducible protein